MLEKMWEKVNTHSSMVGLQTCIATAVINMGVLQESE